MHRFLICCLALTLVVCPGGCTSLKRTDTARTGREQLLLSNAIDQSLSKVNFDAFRGRAVYIEEKYLECIDKGYVAASVRHRVALAGGAIAAKPENADIIVEMRSGGVGTDFADSYLGTPAITLPGGMASIPEIKLISRSHQSGTAKIALAAYDAKSMQLLGEGGVSLSQSHDNNWAFMGVGPFQDGSVKSELSRGTSIHPGQSRRELPQDVVFQEPQTLPGQARYAGTEGQQGSGAPGAIRAVGETAPAGR